MNHEEHVNQLKSEVRYLQEVVYVRGGALACVPLPELAGACGEGPGRSASPGDVPRGFMRAGGDARAGCGTRAPAEPQPLQQTGSGAELSSLLTCLYRAVA